MRRSEEGNHSEEKTEENSLINSNTKMNVQKTQNNLQSERNSINRKLYNDRSDNRDGSKNDWINFPTV